MKPTFSPQDQRWDGELIRALKRLGSFETQYPSELLGARRAIFVKLVERYSRGEVIEELYPEDQEIIGLLSHLKSVETQYPPDLMTARRAAFIRQIAAGNRISVLEVLRTAIRNLSSHIMNILSIPAISMLRTSLVVAVLMLAAFIGFLLRNSEQAFGAASHQNEVSGSGATATTAATESARVICKPGYLPPLCLAKEFDKSQDLIFPGNGVARPAVAKDTLPGYSGVNAPAYVNDGLYGPGTSWISNSPYSWIKIDLGKATTINTVAFGRDRLGNFNDRDPGQFVIAVALSDNIYADGNSSNDSAEYTEVYNSEQTGFNGIVSGPETIQAQFEPVTARFIKLTFANAGTAVDEVEVFMARSSGLMDHPTKGPQEDQSEISVTSIPATTSAPTGTITPVPTDTLAPTNTTVPIPTNTAVPTDTAIPIPTDTPLPPATLSPDPTDTSIPPTEPAGQIIVPTEIPTQMDGP